MDQVDKNQILSNTSTSSLDEEVGLIKSMLSYALDLPEKEIYVSFPSLKNFYVANNIYKSSWAIYLKNDKLPKLLFTGNFLIQGGKFGKRSSRSPFGAQPLSPLLSVANTFSYEASFYKQNWTSDLNLLGDDPEKLKFSVKEYKEFLKLLNIVRVMDLLTIIGFLVLFSLVFYMYGVVKKNNKTTIIILKYNYCRRNIVNTKSVF